MFFSLPAHGHINPSLGVVRELVSRGDRVFYYSTVEFKEKIERAGAVFRDYGEIFNTRGFKSITEDISALQCCLIDITHSLIDKIIDETRESGTDYIIHDSMAIWGKVAAGHLNLPAVNFITTFVFTPEILSGYPSFVFRMILTQLRGMKNNCYVRKRVKELKTRFGYNSNGPMDLLFNKEDLNIVFTSREFQPGGELLDDSFHFIGPSIPENRDSGTFELTGTGRPVIYISLGTIANERSRFYNQCIEAFRGREVDVILSTGSRIDRASLNEAPSNFTIKEHVPQLQILKEAELFITHGGMNSTSEGLYFNTPLLVFPQQIEQAFVARRVVDVGAGLTGKLKDYSPARLWQTAEHLMSSPGYARNAAGISESLKAAGGFAAGADRIKEYISVS